MNKFSLKSKFDIWKTLALHLNLIYSLQKCTATKYLYFSKKLKLEKRKITHRLQRNQRIEILSALIEFNLFVTKMYSYEIFKIFSEKLKLEKRKITHRLQRNQRIDFLGALIEFNLYVTECSDT